MFSSTVFAFNKPLMNTDVPEFLKTFCILLIWKIISYSDYQTMLFIVWQIPAFSLIEASIISYFESKCFFSFFLFLFSFSWMFRILCLSDTPQFSTFHAFSRYLCFLATYGNCFAPLTVILCQTLFCFCLHWKGGIVQEKNSLHLSGIVMLCCALHLLPINSKYSVDIFCSLLNIEQIFL